LSREACKICVAEIVDAVNESVDATECGGKGDCQEGVTCLTHHLWQDLSTQIHTFVSASARQSLVERREVRAISQRQSAREEESLLTLIS